MGGLSAARGTDLVYVSPEAVFEGPQGLSDAFGRYRNEAWWQTGLRRTSPIDLHHGYFRFTWERVERGATVMEGWSFGSPGRGGGHLPGRHLRGIGARAAGRPIMRVRQHGEGTLMLVLVEVDDRVATVTLNRPESRNAISAELHAQLDEAITGLDARDDVGCIVLTGADPAFCAGMDLKSLADRAASGAAGTPAPAGRSAPA